MFKYLLRFTACFFIVSSLSSCIFSEEKDVPSLLITSRDFEDVLVIEGLVEPVHSTTIACPRGIEGTVTYIVEDGTFVEEGEIICQIEVQELQTRYDKLIIDLENEEANLSKTKADLEMQYALLDAQVKSNDAETQIAQLDSLQLEYSPQNQRKIKELELEKVLHEKKKYQQKLSALKVIQQSEVRKIELSIQRLSNLVNSVKSQIEQLTIKAPKSGLALRGTHYVSETKIQVGDIVWSNMPLLMLPQFTEMKVKIYAPERDFKYINVDDSVYYTFDAMPDNRAWGKITKKAPIGKPINRDSKVKLFEIEASIDTAFTRPDIGISANCRVIVRHVKDTIVVPQIAVFDVDSMKVVYVKKNKGYEMRQVLTGYSSPKEIIVTSGLKPNETIALTRPEQSSVKEEVLLTNQLKDKE